jgi:hypothetical protein
MTDKKELDERLKQAAENGNVALVEALLKEGADVDGDRGLPLIWAAYNGHLAVVNVLLDAGADATLNYDGGKTPAQYAKEGRHVEILKALTTPRIVETPEEITFRRPLGNRTLEEIFNFTALERISLVRKSKYGAVEAITYTSFENVNDQSMLRKAFEEHVKRGGNTDEAVVFPNRLSKNTLKREG